jgi:hypothetical protein
MKNSQKHLLSFTAVLVFAVLAISSKVNKIHYGAFNYHNNVEDRNEDGIYIIKNDGEKVYGDKIVWKSGLLAKDQVKVDEQKFKISEVRGIRRNNTYYGRKGNEYIQRIVHGPKINVYVEFTEVTSTSTTNTGHMRTRTYTRTDHYAQKGEDGPMIAFGGQKDIQKLVEDCPEALEMAKISNKKMRKAIKANSNYLNSIFELYNRDCK